MKINNIIRAWEDAAYRNSLSAEERAALPASPVGEIELTDDELKDVMGAAQSGQSTGCNSKLCTRGNSNQPCKDCR